MLRPDTFALTALLALLTGLGPLSVDMYLASFPEIGRLLAAGPADVQLTVSFYLLGFAIGQVVYGPFSDRHGRKPVLLIALAIYLAGTLLCMMAPSIGVLIAGRILQAFGAAGAVVLPRAVVRDLYEGPQVARQMSSMATIMAVAPLVAPLIGSVLQTLFGWRSNFAALLLAGVAAAAAVWLLLPESVRTRAAAPVSVGSVLRSYRDFLGNASFVAHLVIVACCLAGLFAWISATSFVLQELFGLSPIAFGLSFTIGSAGYMLGTAIASRVVMRWGIGRTMGAGTAAMAAGGLAMMGALALGLSNAPAMVFGMAVYLCGMGMVLPQAQAGALLPFPDRAGAASSLVGFIGQTSAAAVGAVLGRMLGASAWPLAAAVAAAGIVAFAAWAATRSVRSAAPRS